MSSNFIPKGYVVVMWCSRTNFIVKKIPMFYFQRLCCCSGTNFIVKKIPMFYVLTLVPKGYVVVMWCSGTNFIVKKIPMFYVHDLSVQWLHCCNVV